MEGELALDPSLTKVAYGMRNNDPREFLSRCFSVEEMKRLLMDEPFHRELLVACSQDAVDRIVLMGISLLANSSSQSAGAI